MKAKMWLLKWRWAQLREKLIMAIAWSLPRPIAYWAAIRVATHNYGGSPDDRTITDMLKGAKDWV